MRTIKLKESEIDLILEELDIRRKVVGSERANQIYRLTGMICEQCSEVPEEEE